MKKIIFSVLLAGLVTAVVVGLYLYNKPHRNVESEKVSVSLNALELFNNYSENEKMADSLFLNKIVEVNGVVSEIIKDQKGERVLLLKEEEEIFGVVCSMDEMDEENKKRVAALKEGDKVRVKGICSGFDSDVKLNKCVLAESGSKDASL